MTPRTPPDYAGENYADLLDDALLRQGHGSANKLARALATPDGLNARQIERRISDFRQDPDGGQTFELVCSVAVAVPELLAEMARRSGFLLVPVPKGDLRASAARAVRSSGNVLAKCLSADEDGIITSKEAAEIDQAADVAEADIEGLRREARAKANGEVAHG